MSAPALSIAIQGQGSVSADNLNTYSQTCDTIAQLRAFVGAPGVQVYIRGLVSVGDGGQGAFVWVANVTGTDDGKSIIVPTSTASGYWERLSNDNSSATIIPCTEVGTNAIVLTPINGVPQPLSYANYQTYAFVAQNTSTSNVTANVVGLPVLNVYLPNNTQAVSGSLVAGQFYMVAYNSALNASAGGFSLIFGSTSTGVTSIADAANGGLAFSASTGAVTGSLAPNDLTAKTVPVLADLVVIGDSAATFAAKKSTVAQLLSGKPIQVVNTEPTASATGTTVIPADNTIPQNTEGDQYMSLAITPLSATSTLIIDVTIVLANSATIQLTAALFQDATASALAAAPFSTNSATLAGTCRFTHKMSSGSTASTTFKIRAGGASAGTTTFNGAGGAQLYGGVCASSITITEVAP